MGVALEATKHYTYADYLTWPDDVRYELVDGRPLLMSPAPTLTHQIIAGQVYRQLANQLEGHQCQALIAPLDVRLPKSNEDDDAVDTVVQPDVLVVCDPSKLSERGVRGAPDWILEVISPGNAAHDIVVKRQLYERAGVREYWLVHPLDRVLTVHRLGVEGLYGRPHLQTLEGRTDILVLPGVQIDWDALPKAWSTGSDNAPS
jgi:Uma2 family endonuclease